MDAFFFEVFINRLGRRTIQMMGFLLMAVFFAVCAAALERSATPAGESESLLAPGFPKWLFVLCYGLTSFLANLGPMLCLALSSAF